MMRKKIVLYILVLLLFITIGGLFFQERLYLNIYTHSLPFGVYGVSQDPPARGMIAATCLNADIALYGRTQGYLTKGTCGTGIMPVIKIIAGIPGDTFEVKNGQFVINGRSYQLESSDHAGRPIKLFYSMSSYTLKQGEYVLLSDYVSNSWDSRYWGPVKIKHILKPWVVLNDKKS